MKIAELSTPSARLKDSTETLLAVWREVAETWTDANSRALEENHIRPLTDEVRAAMAAIRHLSEVLDQAQRACESW